MAREPFLGREAYRHWHTIGTRWADNDAYGHVNNTVHYQWFDTVVNDWLISRGLLDIERGDPIALVVETGCRYAQPLAFPQAVEIGLGVDTLGRSSVTYRLGVFASGCGEAAAQGHFVHVTVDRARRTPVAMPENWRLALASLQG